MDVHCSFISPPNHETLTDSSLPLIKEQAELIDELKNQSGCYKNEYLILRKEISNLMEENQRLYMELQTTHKNGLLSTSPHQRKGTDMVVNLQRQLELTVQEKDSAVGMWQMALKEVDSLEKELKSYECNKHVELAQKQLLETKKEYSEIVALMEEKLKSLSADAERKRLSYQDLKSNFTTVEEDLRKALQNIELKDKEMKEELETTTNAINKIQELEALIAKQSTELTKVHNSRDELEGALEKSQQQIEHLITKEREAHNKVHDALSLVDEAMGERASAILVDANTREENVRLQGALKDLIEEAGAMVKAEVNKIKKSYSKKMNVLCRDMKNIENSNAEKSSLLDRLQREQLQLSMELETSRSAQERVRLPSAVELKVQAAYRVLTESEQRNYQANLEIEKLRKDLKNLQEIHIKFVEKKASEWRKAEERYSAVCRKLVAAEEQVGAMENTLSKSPQKIPSNSCRGDCQMTSNERNELLSQLQEIQTQRLKTDIELQQHLECQRVLKVKWQTTIKSVTNSFEIKIRDLRSKLNDVKREKRAMKEQLNEALRDGSRSLLDKEIST